MEEQRLKHVCKFCRKSFPCGRSLGGHMRSHMVNDVSAQTDGTLITRKKLPSLIPTSPPNDHHQNSNANEAAASSLAVVEKLCKECGKGGFQSWKALFDHTKLHHSIEKEKDEEMEDDHEEEDEDSWENSANNNSQSDRNKKWSIKRRLTRSLGTSAVANSSSFSAVSGVEEQEQEEVALCLMLLSRDVSNWGSSSSPPDKSHHDQNVSAAAAAESSDNNYVLSESANKLEEEDPDCQRPVKGIVVVMKSEVSVPETPRKGSSTDGGSKRKRKLKDCDQQSNLEVCNDNKFECNTCNKSFHSYQALGGHRASHKKTKGCFASILAEEETDHHQLVMMKSINNEILDNEKSPSPPPPPPPHVANRNVASGSNLKKRDVNRIHECPICLKVFPSGQALGGHKRSHLVGTNSGGSSNVHQMPAEVVEAAKISAIKDFLDLNLPAPVDEESTNNNNNNNNNNKGSGSSINVGFNQWWAGNSHKHEQQPLVGLISNL